jgi:hypothetical protein
MTVLERTGNLDTSGEWNSRQEGASPHGILDVDASYEVFRKRQVVLATMEGEPWPVDGKLELSGRNGHDLPRDARAGMPGPVNPVTDEATKCYERQGSYATVGAVPSYSYARAGKSSSGSHRHEEAIPFGIHDPLIHPYRLVDFEHRLQRPKGARHRLGPCGLLRKRMAARGVTEGSALGKGRYGEAEHTRKEERHSYHTDLPVAYYRIW